MIGSAMVAAPATSDALEEVVVSASRLGDQSLQTIPMAITAVDPQSAAREGLVNLADIARLVPVSRFTATMLARTM